MFFFLNIYIYKIPRISAWLTDILFEMPSGSFVFLKKWFIFYFKLTDFYSHTKKFKCFWEKKSTESKWPIFVCVDSSIRNCNESNAAVFMCSVYLLLDFSFFSGLHWIKAYQISILFALNDFEAQNISSDNQNKYIGFQIWGVCSL